MDRGVPVTPRELVLARAYWERSITVTALLNSSTHCAPWFTGPGRIALLRTSAPRAGSSAGAVRPPGSFAQEISISASVDRLHACIIFMLHKEANKFYSGKKKGV